MTRSHQVSSRITNQHHNDLHAVRKKRDMFLCKPYHSRKLIPKTREPSVQAERLARATRLLTFRNMGLPLSAATARIAAAMRNAAPQNPRGPSRSPRRRKAMPAANTHSIERMTSAVVALTRPMAFTHQTSASAPGTTALKRRIPHGSGRAYVFSDSELERILF